MAAHGNCCHGSLYCTVAAQAGCSSGAGRQPRQSVPAGLWPSLGHGAARCGVLAGGAQVGGRPCAKQRSRRRLSPISALAVVQAQRGVGLAVSASFRPAARAPASSARVSVGGSSAGRVCARGGSFVPATAVTAVARRRVLALPLGSSQARVHGPAASAGASCPGQHRRLQRCQAQPGAQADTPRQATHEPHFILAHAWPAAACRLAQTLGVAKQGAF